MKPKPSAQSSRRQFIRRSAAVSLTTASIGSPSLHGADSPAERLRVAFIGTGNQGMGLLKRFLRFDLGQVVAVVDVNQGSYGYKNDDHFYGREPAAKLVNETYAKSKPSYEACVAEGDARRVFDRDDIDAVVLVVPDHSHGPLTEAACVAGQDVYCEKPLSFSVADGQRITEAVRRHGRICQTGSQERSNPQSQFICEAVKAGRIGKVRRIVTKVGFNNKVGPGPGWQPQPVPKTFDYQAWLGTAPKVPYHQDRCLYRFRFNYDYSGGQITNFGAHCNDMALWGMGLDTVGPTTIRCTRAEFLPEGSLFDTATVTRFVATYGDDLELICESGDEAVQVRFEGEHGWMQTGYAGTSASDPGLLEEFPDSKRDASGRDPHAAHLANFVDAVKARRDPNVPVEVGANSALLCHLANIAIRRFPAVGEETLRWNHAAGRFVDHEAANAMLG